MTFVGTVGPDNLEGLGTKGIGVLGRASLDVLSS